MPVELQRKERPGSKVGLAGKVPGSLVSVGLNEVEWPRMCSLKGSDTRDGKLGGTRDVCEPESGQKAQITL